MISLPSLANTGEYFMLPLSVSRTGSPAHAVPARSEARSVAHRASPPLTRRAGSQQLMDDLSSLEDLQRRAGLGVDAGQFGDRRSDHQRGDGVGHRMRP